MRPYESVWRAASSVVITDISLDVLQDLDISFLRGKGLQPGEEELPETQQKEQGKRLHSCTTGLCNVSGLFVRFPVRRIWV